MSKVTLVNFIFYSIGIVLALSKMQMRCRAPITSNLSSSSATSFVFDVSNPTSPSSSSSSSRNITTGSGEEWASYPSSRIPHIIHQSYKSISTLPADWADGPTAWQTFHPHYTYKFWSDEDNRRLIQKHYSWFLPTYDNYPAPIQRADAARYFAVLHYGGIYADMDILPIRNVDPLLNILNLPQHAKKELLVAETYNLGLTNALFASIPNSTILSRFVQKLPYHTRPLHGFERLVPHFAVLLSTGPTRLWIYLNQYRSNIVTIPPVLWGQCHQCHQQRNHACIPQPGSFFETRRGGSWHRWDTRIMNFIFCHVQFCIWGLVCAVYWLYSKVHTRTRINHYCCRNMPSRNSSIGEVVKGEHFLSQTDQCVTKKRKKWWNTPNNDALACSLGNISVRTRVLFAQYRLPIFCGVVFILVL
jgi:mannosyltransferase OCH1-like enzyme